MARRARAALILLVATNAACGAVESEDALRGDAATSESGSTPICESDGWRWFDADGRFGFRGPCSLEGGPGKGVDSFVGAYDDVGLHIEFDYGSYSSSLVEWTTYDEYDKQVVEVDGRPGYVVVAFTTDSSYTWPYLGGLHVPSVDGGTVGLTMYGWGESNERRDVVIDIAKTIDFP